MATYSLKKILIYIIITYQDTSVKTIKIRYKVDYKSLLSLTA
ncbi:hypothetical protein GCWU000282_01922 [Catonella morbi ATCC 51271]|uniref:Uncharacterized protein n=1 Tax=Catonella morbi ATCC 51271 TaxID=592026 RepID=V2XLI9_9FIRM|nr:hypothetical protein GCWU000282_01922 [Catonella morbi ATCC 51271]